MRHVKRHICFFFFHLSTAVVCSVSSIPLLGSFDTCRLDRVRDACGAASSSAATIVDCVFVDGGPEGRGGPTRAACRHWRSFLLMLDLVVAMRVAWICNSLCCGAAFGTLGGDCCIFLFVVIERVMQLFSMISSSILGTGCTRVGVAVGDLVSTNLSRSRSLCLPLLLVMPFNTAVQSAIACMILSACVIVGLVVYL